MKRPAHWETGWQHLPSRQSVLAALEAMAESCGWCSLAHMKHSVLVSRGLVEVKELSWRDGAAG